MTLIVLTVSAVVVFGLSAGVVAHRWHTFTTRRDDS